MAYDDCGDMCDIMNERSGIVALFGTALSQYIDMRTRLHIFDGVKKRDIASQRPVKVYKLDVTSNNSPVQEDLTPSDCVRSNGSS